MVAPGPAFMRNAFSRLKLQVNHSGLAHGWCWLSRLQGKRILVRISAAKMDFPPCEREMVNFGASSCGLRSVHYFGALADGKIKK